MKRGTPPVHHSPYHVIAHTCYIAIRQESGLAAELAEVDGRVDRAVEAGLIEICELCDEYKDTENGYACPYCNRSVCDKCVRYFLCQGMDERHMSHDTLYCVFCEQERCAPFKASCRRCKLFMDDPVQTMKKRKRKIAAAVAEAKKKKEDGGE